MFATTHVDNKSPVEQKDKWTDGTTNQQATMFYLTTWTHTLDVTAKHVQNLFKTNKI